jgi:tetratricopeptide (TPR) repeat protein
MTRPAGLAALIEASQGSPLDLSVDEWRDVLYLCAHLGTSAGTLEPVPGAQSPSSAPPGAGPDRGAETGRAGPTHRVAPGAAAPSVSMAAYTRGRAGGAESVPVRAPAAPVLGRNAFAKALRLLKRPVSSPVEFELDTAATAAQAAESDLWDPVLVPATDRWLGLAVVLDDAASGPAWSAEIRELLRALHESGAFSGVRVWRFNSDSPPDGPLTVRGGAAGALAGRDSRELIDPSGRQAVLLISDCVGAGWGDLRVGRMIEEWAAVNPVAIIHPLPQRLWARCRPRFVPVDWLAQRPVALGQPARWRLGGAAALDPAAAGAASVASTGTLVPVLDLTPSALAQWSTVLAGVCRDWMPGLAFHTASEVADAGDGGAEEPLAATAGDPRRLQVDRFRAVASPQAFRLASLLSAAPLQPQVVRMIQRTMLGTARATYWAEILLSGLVYQVAGGLSGNQPRYEFTEGIRAELLAGLGRRESLDMLHHVSEFICRRMGGTVDFLALLTLDTPPEGLSEVDRPFARVAVEVLLSLGGVYADKAAAINHALSVGVARRAYIPPETEVRFEAEMEVGTAAGDGDLVTAMQSDVPQPAATGREANRAVIWDVPQRTPNFVGRQALLESLRRELVDNPNQAAVLVPRTLFGLGGVGKTALANEYAHRFRSDYEVVWWIPAEDPADVRRSLVELSRTLQLPENTDQAQTIRSLLRVLHDGYPKARWLLIYDNATRPDQIKDLIPMPKRQGHVLITSRDQAWGGTGALLEVDVFARSESVTLLQRRADHLDEAEADRIAELLQDLPLALHQAAAWHSETGLPAAEYRTRYDQKLALLSGVDLPPEYPRPVGAAFGVSYDQLQGRSAAAAQLLQLCSYFGPEPISIEMLYRARNVPGLPPPLNRQMSDRSTIGRELREIGRYELIRLDQARGRFQLHRLVQSVLRSTLPEENRLTGPAHVHSILALANPGNPDELNPADLARHGELSPHILPSGIVGSTDLEARRVVLDQIRYRYIAGDYEGSRDLAESTVNRWREQWGVRDQLVMLAQRHLAGALRAFGDTARALSIDEEVMILFRETVGENDDHYFVTANGYAADLRALGRFREALEFDEHLLAQHYRVLREDDPSTLRTANNYAVDLRLMGHFRRARELDARSVQLWTENYGVDHPETLFAVVNLVRDYYGLGQYGDALLMQQDAVAAQEAALGSTHPHVLHSRRNAAMLLRKLGRYQQARERAEINYAAYLARFPEHHESSLAAGVSLCNALRDENRDLASMRRALELIERMVHLYRRDFVDHPFTHACTTNLAVVLRRLGEVDEARYLNTEATEQLRASLGETHPYALCSATNLAADLAATGDFAAAADLSASVLAASRDGSLRGPEHPYTLAATLNHALDLFAVGRHTEAEALWGDVVPRFDRILGPDHPETLAARNRQRIDADIEPPPT